MRLAPVDPETETVAALGEALLRARAHIERAAHLDYQRARIMGIARIVLSTAQEDYQTSYDRVVVESGNRYQDRSWEERASHYRTQLVDEEIAKRQTERHFAHVEAENEAVEILLRSIYRARNDLAAAADVLKASRYVGDAQV